MDSMPRIKSFLVVTCFLTGWLPLDYTTADHFIYQDSFSRTGSLNATTVPAYPVSEVTFLANLPNGPFLW